MRLSASILFLVLTLFGSLSRAAMVPSGLLCYAFSKGERSKNVANPLTSLRDVRYRLSKLPFAKDPKAGSPYKSMNLQLDLEKPRLGLFRRLEARALVDRLAQLEQHATGVNFDGTYFGYELRGADKIREGRDVIMAEITKYESQIYTELARRYPSFRVAKFAERGMSAALIGLTVSLLGSADHVRAGLLMSPFAALGIGMIEFVYPRLRARSASEDFDRQLKTIESTLASPVKGVPLHAVSGSLEIRAELRHVLLDTKIEDLNNDEIQFLVDASEKIYQNFFDRQLQSREFENQTSEISAKQKLNYFMGHAVSEDFAGERTRHVYYDSLFYFDTEANQPVWLIFYRDFKTRPIPPKPPKQEKRLELKTDSEDFWIPGPRPQLVPIPVRKSK